jgi:hypothetical protein
MQQLDEKTEKAREFVQLVRSTLIQSTSRNSVVHTISFSVFGPRYRIKFSVGHSYLKSTLSNHAILVYKFGVVSLLYFTQS